MESGLGLKGVFSHQKIDVIAVTLPLPPLTPSNRVYKTWTNLSTWSTYVPRLKKAL